MIKHRIHLLFLLIFSCAIPTVHAQTYRQTIDLKGEWQFALDPQNDGIQRQLWNESFSETVQLPGTTDSNGKGEKNDNRSETSHLSRLFRYEGVAWYSRVVTIPEEWKKKDIELFMERTRPSRLWIDGKEAGSCNYLSVPQRYNLSSLLTPGEHRITVRVDNGKSIPQQIRSSSHACTESTQTNWNGIIGRIELQARNTQFIASLKVTPLVAQRSVKVRVTLSRIPDWLAPKFVLSATSFNTQKKHQTKVVTFPLESGLRDYEFIYELGDDALLWSDLNPALYKLNVELEGLDACQATFGLRDFKAQSTHFTINGVPTFLRGKHDAAVFPLTGYIAMNVEEWRRYFRICKEYGLNHCRFHSWCPPTACFEAADLEGIYLQPELPIWGSFRKGSEELLSFLEADGLAILKEYSDHPSFVMFALGNELSGELEVMKALVDYFRETEPRHLYTFGSNIFLGSKGHIEGEDFLVTCRVGSGEGYSTHARASFSFADADEGGYLNNTYPNTSMNFDSALVRSKVPVIGHETGQFQVYPHFSEMNKYTGVLAPWNMEVFRSRLVAAKMEDQAEAFFRASGAWAVELYRADIEMNLRSKRMAGFQLLDLQDYPGQGSAYVGVLDAFMDSKGLIDPLRWREFCSEVVPLLYMDKYCWTGGELFNASVEVANYGGVSLKNKALEWELRRGKSLYRKGRFSLPTGHGVITAGDLSLHLPDVLKAEKMELILTVRGTSYRNRYPLWVYPVEKRIVKGDVVVARRLTEQVLAQLSDGAKVFLMPIKSDCEAVSVGGLFQTDYWNFRMFNSICERIKKPSSPGTLGIFTQPEHPLFNDFPTESHTNWQWYPIVKNSFPLLLDRTPRDYRPIVQVIDNVERNHKLGLVFEFRVGKGKLLVCMADLERARTKPEGFQFYASLLDYMQSEAFNPTAELTTQSLLELFEAKNEAAEIKVLNNISYD